MEAIIHIFLQKINSWTAKNIPFWDAVTFFIISLAILIFSLILQVKSGDSSHHFSYKAAPLLKENISSSGRAVYGVNEGGVYYFSFCLPTKGSATYKEIGSEAAAKEMGRHLAKKCQKK